MATISLRGHYDGERILLDEPFALPTNTPLLITVLQDSLVGSLASGVTLGIEGISGEDFGRALRALPKLPKRIGSPATLELVNELRDEEY